MKKLVVGLAVLAIGCSSATKGSKSILASATTKDAANAKKETYTFMLPASAELTSMAKTTLQMDAVHIKITPKDNCSGSVVDTILPFQHGYSVDLLSGCEYTAQFEVGVVNRTSVTATQAKGESSTGCWWWFFPPQPTPPVVNPPKDNNPPKDQVPPKDNNPPKDQVPPTDQGQGQGQGQSQNQNAPVNQSAPPAKDLAPVTLPAATVSKDDSSSQVKDGTVDPKDQVTTLPAVPEVKADMANAKMDAIYFVGEYLLDLLTNCDGLGKTITLKGSDQQSSATDQSQQQDKVLSLVFTPN